MKRTVSVLLVILLMLGSLSAGFAGVAAKADAQPAAEKTGVFAVLKDAFENVKQWLRGLVDSIAAWFASLFQKKPQTQDPGEIEIDLPPTAPPDETDPSAPTDATDPSEPTDAADPSAPTDASEPGQSGPVVETVAFNPAWEYADYSAIHTDSVKLYRSQATELKHKVICINAGHGCRGGSEQFTYCHPDHSPKVTGGSTAAGAIKATSINGGTTLNDGTPEATATLELAITVKNTLLEAGYDVLMIRETEDAQLDNIARTVFANNNADCHIALHYDSSETDKGLFFTGVPNVASYRNMEPVKSHFEEHTLLGEALIEGARAAGVKIYSSGRVDIDLTQTSYSTIPSVDLEVGDRASAHDEAQQEKIAAGILHGLDRFFG